MIAAEAYASRSVFKGEQPTEETRQLRQLRQPVQSRFGQGGVTKFTSTHPTDSGKAPAGSLRGKQQRSATLRSDRTAPNSNIGDAKGSTSRNRPPRSIFRPIPSGGVPDGTIRRGDNFPPPANDRHRPVARTAQRPPPVKPLPDFVTAREQPEDPSIGVVSGWGTGGTGIKPLEYGNEVQPRPHIPDQSPRNNERAHEDSKSNPEYKTGFRDTELGPVAPAQSLRGRNDFNGEQGSSFRAPESFDGGHDTDTGMNHRSSPTHEQHSTNMYQPPSPFDRGIGRADRRDSFDGYAPPQPALRHSYPYQEYTQQRPYNQAEPHYDVDEERRPTSQYVNQRGFDQSVGEPHYQGYNTDRSPYMPQSRSQPGGGFLESELELARKTLGWPDARKNQRELDNRRRPPLDQREQQDNHSARGNIYDGRYQQDAYQVREPNSFDYNMPEERQQQYRNNGHARRYQMDYDPEDSRAFQGRQRASQTIAPYQTREQHPHREFYDDRGYGESGYRISPFDPQRFNQRQSFDDDRAADWQHLRSRSVEPPPQVPQLPEQYPAQRRLSADDIDRQFEDYRRNRATPRQPQYPVNPNIQNVSSPGNAVAGVRCGRCLEYGHVAKNCKGVNRATCNLCGQVGHIARECPSQGRAREGRRQKDSARDTQSQPGYGSREQREYRPAVRSTESARYPEIPSPLHSSERGDGRQNPTRQERGQTDRTDDIRDGGRESEYRRPVQDQDDEETPQERVLRSRKFAVEDAPRRGKAMRRGRRDEDEDDESDLNDKPRARRSRRGFEDEEDAEDYFASSKAERQDRKSARQALKEKKAKEAARKAARAQRKAEQSNPVNLPEFISVATLAQTLGVRYEPFVERLAELGYDDVFPGQVLNAETSGMIAMEYNFDPVFDSSVKEADERDLKARPEVEDKTFLPTRPPVVTIMGHVDHGKTTILDYLRKSSVAAGEAGGITQHIGAFSVPLSASGKTITFLDTPGHAAFLAMRQRGANVTDIVILVVAADDSVKPQTIEAIKHAKAARVPMIVAINKVDKEESDIQRVKQDLARHGVEIEDFGGDTQVVCVSGKTGQGMDELEEAAVTLSEILDHRAETDGAVEGWVIEATTKKAGRVATVLMRRGTLKTGTVIVAGKTWARVRTLKNEAGRTIADAGPGMPVEVDGWRDQPAAGDEVLEAPTEQKANSVVDYRVEKEEREKTAQDMEVINEQRRLDQEKREKEKALEAAKKAGTAEDEPAESNEEKSHEDHGPMSVPFIIKADVSGSVEAVSAYIQSVSSPLISPRILQSGVGPIHESDIELAAAAEGHIISFNLPKDDDTKGMAESRGVKVLENNIIYRVLDDVKAVLEDKLPPIVTQKVVGEADISAGFEIGVGGRKKMKIAGCKVRNGVVSRNSRVRVLRGDEKVYDGKWTLCSCWIWPQSLMNI